MPNPYKPLSSLQGLYDNMSSPFKSSPMGVPAKSPQNNTANVANVLNFAQTQKNDMSTTTPSLGGDQSYTPPKTQVPAPVSSPSPAPVATPSQPQVRTPQPTAPTPNPTPNPSYPGIVNAEVNTGLYGTPQVNKANDDLLGFQKSYADYQNSVGTMPNPFGFATGVGQLAQNRYAQELPAYQGAVSNALTSQGQRIGALGSAAGQSAPTSQFGVLTNPFSGQPIGGGTPQSAAFQGGQIGNSQALGGQYQTNQASITGARSLGQQFVSQFNAVPEFNSNPVNAINALSQFWQNNTSNPNYPALQSTFNNILNAYAGVLGGRDQVASLIKSAQPSSMQALIQSLDSQANAVNQGIFNTGTGQNGSPSATGSYSGPTININGTVLPTSY